MVFPFSVAATIVIQTAQALAALAVLALGTSAELASPSAIWSHRCLLRLHRSGQGGLVWARCEFHAGY